MMNMHNLRIFSAVAETGGVSRAAGVLNMVQSNVTARLKDLERDLETELFHRTGKGMVLTAAGEVLLKYAVRLQRLADEAERAVRDCDDGGGLLRIGTLETTAAVRLPGALKRLNERFPRLDIRLTAKPTDALLEDLLDYRMDGAFVGGRVDHPELTGEVVFPERLVLVRPRLLSGRQETGSPLIIVFRQGCSYRAQTERWVREQGRLPFRMMEIGTLDGILGCIAAGLGVTLLPEAFVALSRFAPDVETETIPERFADMPTYFMRRKDVPVSSALEGFLQLLREEPPVGSESCLERPAAAE